VLAIAATASPALASALEFRRGAIAAGETWRLLTGHLPHFGAEHLAWDLAMFVLLGVLAVRESARLAAATVVLSAVVVPLAVWTLLPGLESYRGLSGLDSALYAVVAVVLLRRALGERRHAEAVLASLALLALAAKVAYEHATGSAAFVSAASFVPVPVAHAAGALVGAAVGCIGRSARRAPAGFAEAS